MRFHLIAIRTLSWEVRGTARQRVSHLALFRLRDSRNQSGVSKFRCPAHGHLPQAAEWPADRPASCCLQVFVTGREYSATVCIYCTQLPNHTHNFVNTHRRTFYGLDKHYTFTPSCGTDTVNPSVTNQCTLKNIYQVLCTD